MQCIFGEQERPNCRAVDQSLSPVCCNVSGIPGAEHAEAHSTGESSIPKLSFVKKQAYLEQSMHKQKVLDNGVVEAFLRS
jgi:hypothetical protein